MAIPEAQLEVWTHQGSVAQSRDTYASIKAVLEDSRSPHSAVSFETFLQGSYGNDTNVYRDSDVDVVMRLDSTWYHDADLLPSNQYQAFEATYPGSAAYGLGQFKIQVHQWLADHFDGVVTGSKAIFIPARGARRDCDVLVCAKFRYYYQFNGQSDQRFAEGICFFLRDGARIVNFPKQHSDNCTSKHKTTTQWFKPMVRVYKNMRNHLVSSGALRDGIAPSYFIEGMLWNIPDGKFGRSYEQSFIETFNYLMTVDRSSFRCANGIHQLLQSGSHISWDPVDCESFLNSLRALWNSWR